MPYSTAGFTWRARESITWSWKNMWVGSSFTSLAWIHYMELKALSSLALTLAFNARIHYMELKVLSSSTYLSMKHLSKNVNPLHGVERVAKWVLQSSPAFRIHYMELKGSTCCATYTTASHILWIHYMELKVKSNDGSSVTSIIAWIHYMELKEPRPASVQPPCQLSWIHYMELKEELT